MALTHTDAVRNLAADAKLDQIDTGATNPTGQLVYMDAADATIATADMSNPAFQPAVAGVKTANAIADTAPGTGTIALYKIVNRDGIENHRGTVTAVGGGGDIEITSITLNNEPVRTTSYVYTEGA